MLKRSATLTVLALVCTGPIVVLSASSAAAEPAAKPFTIKSSLDGKTALPHRIRWFAYPSTGVLFPGIEFLIDGKVVVSNRLPPYAFGDDGRDEATGSVNTGYLVTSWLGPGKHRFTVRARGLGPNRKTVATKTVVARVRAAPARPAQLLGTWQRNLPSAVPPDRDMLYRRVTAPPGTYTIAVDRRFIRISGPDPRKHIKIDYVAGARTITIRGPVWTGDPNEGGWCEPWGPETIYSWSVNNGTLTLARSGEPDACKQRGTIVTGEWTRVK
jgi:hypothetical protein